MRWISNLLTLAMAGSLQAERVMMYQDRFSDSQASYSLLVNGERPINEFGNPGRVPGGASSYWVARVTYDEQFEDRTDSPFFGEPLAEAWLKPLIWSVDDFSLDWEDADIQFESDDQSLRVSVQRAAEVVVGDRHELPDLETTYVSDFPTGRASLMDFVGSVDWREATWRILGPPRATGSGAPNLLFDDVVGGERVTVQLENWRLAPHTVGGGSGLALFMPNRPDFPIPEPSGIVLFGLSALLLLPILARMRRNSR